MKYIVRQYLMVCQEVTVYADSPYEAIDEANKLDQWVNTEDKIDDPEGYEVFDEEDTLICQINVA